MSPISFSVFLPGPPLCASLLPLTQPEAGSRQEEGGVWGEGAEEPWSVTGEMLAPLCFTC